MNQFTRAPSGPPSLSAATPPVASLQLRSQSSVCSLPVFSLQSPCPAPFWLWLWLWLWRHTNIAIVVQLANEPLKEPQIIITTLTTTTTTAGDQTTATQRARVFRPRVFGHRVFFGATLRRKLIERSFF